MNTQFVIKSVFDTYLGHGNKFFSELHRAKTWTTYKGADQYLSNLRDWHPIIKQMWAEVFVVPVDLMEQTEPWTRHDIEYAARNGWALFQIMKPPFEAQCLTVGSYNPDALLGDDKAQRFVEEHAKHDLVCAKALRITKKLPGNWRSIHNYYRIENPYPINGEEL